VPISSLRANGRRGGPFAQYHLDAVTGLRRG
jgi:hypothetical protein